MLNDCKVCGKPWHEDCNSGPVLQGTVTYYGKKPNENYVSGYTIFCVDCGTTVGDEYLDDLLILWNGYSDVT